VSVGVVALQIALAQPQNAPCAQCFSQALFQGFAVEAGVAAAVQQAAFGGQEGAGAIAFDGAAFQYPVVTDQFSRAERAACVQACGEGVVVHGGVTTAPAVEVEVQEPPPAVVGEHRDRAGVADPDIIVG
jgi:hypothetical protein